jgi:hypothetical protein
MRPEVPENQGRRRAMELWELSARVAEAALAHAIEGAALAHAIEDKVEAAYRRGDLFDKRRRMDARGEFCGDAGHLRHQR